MWAAPPTRPVPRRAQRAAGPRLAGPPRHGRRLGAWASRSAADSHIADARTLECLGVKEVSAVHEKLERRNRARVEIAIRGMPCLQDRHPSIRGRVEVIRLESHAV